MIITGLVRKGSKVKIYFEDGTFILVSFDIAMESGLRKNDDISENKKENLIRRNELFEIKNAAFRLLSRRLHSTNELRLKLVQKKYSKGLIDEVIDYLTENNYLNDLEFAEKYANEKITIRKVGTCKVKGELIKKGIDREVIEELLGKYNDDPIITDNALNLAQKKISFYSSKNISDQQKKQKIYAYLKGKGFKGNIISEIIAKLEFDRDDELN